MSICNAHVLDFSKCICALHNMPHKEKYGEVATHGERYWTFCGSQFNNDEPSLLRAIEHGEVTIMCPY